MAHSGANLEEPFLSNNPTMSTRSEHPDEPPEPMDPAGRLPRGDVQRTGNERAHVLKRHQAVQARRRWPPFAQKLGRRIRRLRDHMDMKQEALAFAAGCSQSMLSRIEAGKVLPDFMQMVLIARALKRPVDYFAVDEEQPVHAEVI